MTPTAASRRTARRTQLLSPRSDKCQPAARASPRPGTSPISAPLSRPNRSLASDPTSLRSVRANRCVRRKALLCLGSRRVVGRLMRVKSGSTRLGFRSAASRGSTVAGGGTDSCCCARAIAGKRTSTAAAATRSRLRTNAAAAQRPQNERRERDRRKQHLHARGEGKPDAECAGVPQRERRAVARLWITRRVTPYKSRHWNLYFER